MSVKYVGIEGSYRGPDSAKSRDGRSNLWQTHCLVASVEQLRIPAPSRRSVRKQEAASYLSLPGTSIQVS